MKQIGNYVILESAEDFKRGIFDYGYKIQLGIGVVHYNHDKENFPQFYKCINPHYRHVPDEWISCDKKEVINFIETEINALSNALIVVKGL